MGFSIGEVANQLDMTAYTIRYYDKMGLLAKMQRDECGKRIFSREDIDRLGVIKCLKQTGMPVADIKEFIKLYARHDDTIDMKKQMIVKQKEMLEEKIAFLEECVEQSKFKLWFYDNIVQNHVEPPYSDENYMEWKRRYNENKG